MQRVLYISNYRDNIGGISQQVHLLKNLVGDEISFKTSIFSTKGNIIKRIFLFFKLFQIGRNYDVFHIHGCSYWGFLPIVYGVTTGHLLRKKIIITYHGGDASIYLKKNHHLTRFFLAKAHHIIVLSGYLKSVFNSLGYKVNEIPNIVVTRDSDFKLREVIKPRFITTRSLEPLYNIRLVIEAFHIIQKKYSDSSLTIVGDGTLKNDLISFANQLQVKNIVFLGNIANSKIFDQLEQADIMINAPLIDNMPVSLLEAFSKGVLVISSNVGGVPFMIEPKINGLLFNSNNLTDLVNQIYFALENQEKSKEMIINANNLMHKYTWKTIKYEILGLYKK